MDNDTKRVLSLSHKVVPLDLTVNGEYLPYPFELNIVMNKPANYDSSLYSNDLSAYSLLPVSDMPLHP